MPPNQKDNAQCSFDAEDEDTSNTLLLGKTTGTCDICKQTKQVLLLKYGFCLCQNCLTVCTAILERLTQQPPEQTTNEETGTS
jgi:hypothetical protein